MTYLIIGSGKLAKHMRFYLHSEGHSTLNWSRKKNEISILPAQNALHEKELKDFHNIADKTLLLISDSALNTFLNQYPYLRTKNTIHFSGASNVPGIENIHPLMSFSHNLYSKEFYHTIPFALFIDEAEPSSQFLTEDKSLQDIFPGFKNPYFYIRQKDKALYHAFCVIIGNFSTLLWQNGISKAEEYLSLPKHSISKETFKPYLGKILENFITQKESSLTGPLARNDIATIKENLESLPEKNLKDLYLLFVKLYSENLAYNLDLN